MGMHSWGKLWTKRYKETKNTQLLLLKTLEQEQGIAHGSAHTTTKGVGKPPEPHVWPDSWTCPYSSIKGTSSLLPWGS